jgi:hypothetical protein
MPTLLLLSRGGFVFLTGAGGRKRIGIVLRMSASAALQAHRPETRISAIAHFARECDQEKKALLLSLFDTRN